jgi:bacterial/archaeal transporter family protein
VIPTLVYIAASGTLGVLSKVALRRLRWPELVMWCGIVYTCVGIVMLITGQAKLQIVPGTGWAVVGTVAVVTALYMFFVALSTGQVAQVVSISASYPAVTLILAAIFLSEGITVLKAAGVLVVIAGVVVLTGSDEAA